MKFMDNCSIYLTDCVWLGASPLSNMALQSLHEQICFFVVVVVVD